MESLCGMLPFISKDNPNQVYRLWLSLFLHAGILHLCLSIFFQVIHPKHPISTKNISTLDGCTSWFGKTSRLVENWINLYFIGCGWKSWFGNFCSISTWCRTEWSLFWSHCLFICRIYTIMAAAWPTVGLFSNILVGFLGQFKLQHCMKTKKVRFGKTSSDSSLFIPLWIASLGW